MMRVMLECYHVYVYYVCDTYMNVSLLLGIGLDQKARVTFIS